MEEISCFSLFKSQINNIPYNSRYQDKGKELASTELALTQRKDPKRPLNLSNLKSYYLIKSRKLGLKRGYDGIVPKLVSPGANISLEVENA